LSFSVFLRKNKKENGTGLKTDHLFQHIKVLAAHFLFGTMSTPPEEPPYQQLEETLNQFVVLLGEHFKKVADVSGRVKQKISLENKLMKYQNSKKWYDLTDYCGVRVSLLPYVSREKALALLNEISHNVFTVYVIIFLFLFLLFVLCEFNITSE
jgi:hypothetical protein